MRVPGSRVICSSLFLLCVWAWTPVCAQQKEVPEPEKADAIYLLDTAKESLQPLPREVVKEITRPRLYLGPKDDPRFFLAHHNVQILEPASAFRLNSGKNLVFVSRYARPRFIGLYPFRKKGGNREATIGSEKQVGIWVWNSEWIHTYAGSTGGIDFDLIKYGKSSYKLAVQPLEPGEYGFVVGWSVGDSDLIEGYDVFDFAVD
jgi:hypothetical protein